MLLFSRDSQFRRWHRGCLLAVILVASVVAPGVIDAQACGGNSTVDILGAETAASARAFLVRLQSAVRSNNKQQIAGMVDYPLLLLRSGTRTRIRQRQRLIANYDLIFTPAVRDAILRQTARCLFGNSSGAMVGRGAVWFREQAAGQWKIITVNQAAP